MSPRRAGRNLEDLAALVAQLDLFLGIAVLDDPVVERHDIVGDGNRPLVRRRKGYGAAGVHQGRGADACTPHLSLELVDASPAGTRDSL